MNPSQGNLARDRVSKDQPPARHTEPEAERDKRKVPTTGKGSSTALDAMIRKRQLQPAPSARGEAKSRRKR